VSPNDRRGFTVIEVLAAVLILGIGITALVGSSALVTRQIGRGRILTIASEVATQRLEKLRLLSRPVSGGSPCTQGGFASSTAPDTVRSVVESWAVSGSGTSRTVTVTVAYPRQGGTSTFTLSTIVGCY
jgi:prepilin-type N-terminal cleavage/methylation domain-containing protein